MVLLQSRAFENILEEVKYSDFSNLDLKVIKWKENSNFSGKVQVKVPTTFSIHSSQAHFADKVFKVFTFFSSHLEDLVVVTQVRQVRLAGVKSWRNEETLDTFSHKRNSIYRNILRWKGRNGW